MCLSVYNELHPRKSPLLLLLQILQPRLTAIFSKLVYAKKNIKDNFYERKIEEKVRGEKLSGISLTFR